MKRALILGVALALVGCDKPISVTAAAPSSGIVLAGGDENAVLYQSILEKKATFEEILKVFKGNDRLALSNNINALKRYRSDTKVIELLKGVWNQDTARYPGFSWSLLREPFIRLAIAFALHDLDRANASAYLDFTRRHLWEGDSWTRSSAAANLGIIGSNVDIPVLEKLVVEGDVIVAVGAASALGMLRTPESRSALEKLSRSNQIDDQKRDTIRQVLSSSVWNSPGQTR
jgi:HEAT repeat protein